MSLTGLFFGAGASCELGMPLVWDLTSEIRRFLVPGKVRTFNEGWLQQGTGWDKEVVEHVETLLQNQDLHYENILGNLEIQFRRSSRRNQDFHSAYSWLVELVYTLLYQRQILNSTFLNKNISYFYGLSQIAADNHPLWIFSLNHDLLVECMSAHFNIPISCGFDVKEIDFPRRDINGKIVGRLTANTLTTEQINTSSGYFFQKGRHGINLLKIHGSLDTFTFNEGSDLCKIKPEQNSIQGYISSLNSTNEELKYIHPQQPNQPLKVQNEIAYADDTGEMQFLRRTILSGAFKFDKSSSQVLPMKILDHFRTNINYISKLVCVGYGFGDDHINRVMREWLEFSNSRTIEIVSPASTTIPSSFGHLTSQITVTKARASDYFDSYAKIQRTKADESWKELIHYNRLNPEKSREQFQEFANALMKNRVDEIIKSISTLPIKDGDIDVSATGKNINEIIDELKPKDITFETIVEDFMRSIGLKDRG